MKSPDRRLDSGRLLVTYPVYGLCVRAKGPRAENRYASGRPNANILILPVRARGAKSAKRVRQRGLLAPLALRALGSCVCAEGR